MFDYQAKPGQALSGRITTPSEKPLVSVIMPFYNAAAYFEESFNSLLNQTFPWFEWILMDDGSTDPASLELLSALPARDGRIRVFHRENGGAAAARNEAAAKARTDLLLFFDADDLVEENTLEMLYFALLRHPEAAWAYTDIVTFGEKEYLWQKNFTSDVEKRENVVSVCSLVRREAFEKVGGFSVVGRFFNEDWHLWLKMLAEGYAPAHVKQLSFWYRRLPSGGLAAMANDPAAAERNRRAIREVAGKVPGGVEAVRFKGIRKREFTGPERWPWDRTLPYRTEKIRVLMLIPHMVCGGADLFNLDILNHLDRERYEIGVITTLADDDDWEQRFLRAAGDVFPLHAFLDVEDWPAFVAYYIRSRGVQIVINLSSYHAYYWFPWLRAEFPDVVLTDCVHAESDYWLSGGYPRISGAMADVLEKTFVTNDFTLRAMIDRYGRTAEQLQPVYTGIDEKRFRPDADARRAVREKYALSDRPTVLYLCRICPEKRPFLMLKIADRVRREIPDVCFLVVGEGEQYEPVRMAARSMGLQKTVQFAGSVPDPAPFYCGADVFLLCSIKEGLSITTMEALSSGLPMVSAAVGSQYELVDSETGRLIPCLQDARRDFDARAFPDEEVQAYVDAVVTLLKDPRERETLGRKCREKILRGFTRSITMDTLDHSFQTLLTDSQAFARRKAVCRAVGALPGIQRELSALYTEYVAQAGFCDHLLYKINTVKRVVNMKPEGRIALKRYVKKHLSPGSFFRKIRDRFR